MARLVVCTILQAEEKPGKKDRATKEKKESAEAKKGKQPTIKEEPSKESAPETPGMCM